MSVFNPMTTSAEVLFPSSTSLGNNSPAEKTRSQSHVSSNLASIEGPGPHSEVK